ncbi:unnamed protein product [Cladocopium goreaui]|uniref:Uncharacterized protein n=1 Tax=Cladocopium goreaui TaxID=2562237 RepID=A0A9P1G946_9DINO|nr:unnamed protein product [Cladocopium goreaui]
MGASVCHGDSFCGLGGSSVQHNEMRPRSSRKDQYDTSGTPKGAGANETDGADMVPSSVRLKDEKILGCVERIFQWWVPRDLAVTLVDGG